MLIVISYDVADDKRLARVAKEVENYGTRVQRSIFECYLDEERLNAVRDAINNIIDKEADHVRYYRLCKKDEGKVILLGKAITCKDYDYFVV